MTNIKQIEVAVSVAFRERLLARFLTLCCKMKRIKSLSIKTSNWMKKIKFETIVFQANYAA